jgi:hypothetical protein
MAAMGRPAEDRFARSVRASGRRGVRRRDRAGIDARPTIAVTTARISLPIRQRIASGDIAPDGRVVLDSGEIRVTKAAIDPVGICPGSPPGLASPSRTCAAICSKKPAACSPS